MVGHRGTIGELAACRQCWFKHDRRHIQVVKDSVKQLPKGYRSGRKVMIRTDSAGGAHGFLDWLTAKGRNFSYSVGFPIHGAVDDVTHLIPKNG